MIPDGQLSRGGQTPDGFAKAELEGGFLTASIGAAGSADTLGAWLLERDERTVYDEWNPVAQIDAAGTVVQRHLRGTDLRGAPQGAGGVGGLLGTWGNGATTRDGSGPGDGVARVWVCAYDGNGNVSAAIAKFRGTGKLLIGNDPGSILSKATS